LIWCPICRYEFQDGIFIAHRQIESTAFEPDGIIKVLPDNTCVVEIEETAEDALYVLEPTPTTPSPPTWRVIDNADEMEEWLLRRNRWHLQQMYVKERPPTTPAFSGILSDHGTSHIADQLLSGDFDVTSLSMGVEMEEFLRHLKMTPEEKKLKIHSRLSREDF
jgi:hypothetical protein